MLEQATITSVAFTNVPPNSTYLTIGNHIEVTVTFNQAVTVTGTPHVRLTWFTSFTSSIVKHAEHVPSASSGASQVFRYTVAKDDSAVNVEITENALRLNSGTIATGGAAANLNHAGTRCPHDCVVDARVPRIVAPRSTAPYVHRVDTDLDGTVDTFPPNSKLHYSVIFDVTGMAVDNAGSNANVQIVVVIGDRQQALDFNSVGWGQDAENSELIFGPYTVVAEDRDPDGIEVVPDASGNLIRLSNGATIKGNGNVADLSGVASVQERTAIRGTNAAPDGSDLTMITAADTDRSFTKADFTFTDDDGDLLKEIRIVALPASAAGKLKLSGQAITNADLPKTVSVFDLSAGKLVFDPEATFSGTTSFRFQVVDTFGAAAASVNTATVTVDDLTGAMVAAAIVSDPGADQTYGAGRKIRVRLTFGFAVDVYTSGGTPRLKIKMDPDYGEKWAVYESGSGTAALVFAFGPVARPNLSPAGVAVLANTLETNGGTLRIAGTERDAPLDHAGLPHDPNHKVDHRVAANAPDGRPAVTAAIVSDPGADQTYGAGRKIRVRLTFGFAVDVYTSGGTPRLKIKMDPDYGEKWAVYETGSGTREIVFAFGPVARPNLSPRGVAVLANTLETNGGQILYATTEPNRGADAPLGHAGLPHDPNHKVDHRVVKPLSPCGNGVVIPNPDDKPQLVADCETLWLSKDILNPRGNALTSWNGQNALGTWRGVTIGGSPQRVTRLFLYNVGLTGSIPEQIGDLTGLTHLDLGTNRLTGEIPSTIGNLVNLVELTLNGNKLTGELPESLGNLVGLVALHLNENGLTGEIPSSVSKMTKLWHLHLTNNNITGDIPSELGDMPNLGQLLANYNLLSGPIPDLSGTALTELKLGNNRLTGPIPAWLGEKVSLVEINLDGNPMSGPIPDLSKLTNLYSLSLQDMGLTGPVPSLSQTSLREIVLAGNSLSGCLPDGLKPRLTTPYSSSPPYGTVGVPFCADEARPNAPATGKPRISGTVQVDETLTADTSGIADADGLEGVSFAYQWLADDADIAGATSAAYTLTASDEGKAIRVRVSFTDDQGHQETLTSAATGAVAAGLTASFADLPAEHDGKRLFRFELRFSQDFPGRFDYKRLRDHAFQVENGVVREAKRVAQGQNQRWRIAVRPASYDDVTLVLPAAADCTAPGAVCTAAGQQLTNTVAATVPGPAGLSVADARAKEGVDETINFAVSLHKPAAGPVTVDYETANGTATAGEDYVAASGTLTFAVGETEQTVAVPVLDDAHDEGEETFRLRLANPQGAYILDRVAVGTIENADPLQQAWLARFGRTVGTHVTDAVGERLRGSGAPGTHVTVGGYRLPLGKDTADTGGPALLQGLAGILGLGLPQAGGAGSASEGAAGTGSMAWGPGPAPGSDPRLGPSQAVQVDLRRLLLGSSFRLALGAAAADGASPRLTAWGRVAGTTFDGQDGNLSLNGDVFTGTVGVDGAWGRWLAGVAVAHSRGDGSFTMPGTAARGQGELENTLTSLHPYLRYAVNERLAVWGLVGYGWGQLDLELANGVTMETDTNLMMGAFGGRGILLAASESGGVQLATRTDAMLTRTSSDAVAGLAASDGDAHRLRLVLEGSRGVTWADGRTLTPTVELGLRHDWGDAETGFGLEVGGRVQYADPTLGLTVEGAVRGLLAHEDSDYQEWGASGTLRLAPGAAGQGLALTVTPTWGVASSGVEGLWTRQTTAGLAPNTRPAQTGQVSAEVGYGFAAFDSGLLTPYAGTVLAEGAARTYRVGTRWQLTGGRATGLTLNLEGTRQEPAGPQLVNQGVRLQAEWQF